MSMQGMSLLRDRSVIGGVQGDGLVTGDELDLADDHLDRGFARILVFFKILTSNQRDHGLLQRVLAAAVQVMRGAAAGRFASLVQHGLGNGGQRVFFHAPSLQLTASRVTGTTRESPREVTS